MPESYMSDSLTPSSNPSGGGGKGESGRVAEGMGRAKIRQNWKEGELLLAEKGGWTNKNKRRFKVKNKTLSKSEIVHEKWLLFVARARDGVPVDYVSFESKVHTLPSNLSSFGKLCK